MRPLTHPLASRPRSPLLCPPGCRPPSLPDSPPGNRLSSQPDSPSAHHHRNQADNLRLNHLRNLRANLRVYRRDGHLHSRLEDPLVNRLGSHLAGLAVSHQVGQLRNRRRSRPPDQLDSLRGSLAHSRQVCRLVSPALSHQDNQRRYHLFRPRRIRPDGQQGSQLQSHRDPRLVNRRLVPVCSQLRSRPNSLKLCRALSQPGNQVHSPALFPVAHSRRLHRHQNLVR